MNNIFKMANRSVLINGSMLLMGRLIFESNLLKKKYTSMCEPKDYKLEFNEHKNKIKNMDLKEVKKYIEEKKIFGDEIKKVVIEKKYNEIIKIIKIKDDALINKDEIKKWIEENLEIYELKYFFENEFHKFENERCIEFLIENYVDYINIATLLSNKNLTKNNSKIYFSKIRNKMDYLKNRRKLKLLPSNFYDFCDEDTLIRITSTNNFDILIKEIKWENNSNLFRKIYDKIIQETENYLKKRNSFWMNLHDDLLTYADEEVDNQDYGNFSSIIKMKKKCFSSVTLTILFGLKLYEFNEEKLNDFILKCLLKNNNKLDDVLSIIFKKGVNENRIYDTLLLEIRQGTYKLETLKILLKKINIDKLERLKNRIEWFNYDKKLDDRLLKFKEIIDNEEERRKIYGQEK